MERALEALKHGEVIALPTETLYGLTADPFHPLALERLLRLKARPAEKGFILLIGQREQLEEVALPPSPLARRFMERFWPGPLTLALPARPELNRHPLLARDGFVAVRHSPAPRVVELMALWRHPLISTSANRSGEATPATADGVRRLWPEERLIVIDGQTRPDALPSTLLRIDGERATLLRPGAIPVDSLRLIASL